MSELPLHAYHELALPRWVLKMKKDGKKGLWVIHFNTITQDICYFLQLGTLDRNDDK